MKRQHIKKVTPQFNRLITAGYSFNYADAVGEALRDFPHLEKTLLFLDVETGAFIQPLNENNSKNPYAAASTFNKCVAACREHNSSCLFGPTARGYSMLALYLEENSAVLLGKKTPLDQNHYFAFDHELAHIAITQGHLEYYSTNYQECIADTYAALRHFQRFGLESDAIERLIYRRDSGAISAKAEDKTAHYTSPVLEKLLELKNNLSVEKLTIGETVQLTQQLVEDYAPFPFDLQIFSDTVLKPLNDKIKTYKSPLKIYAREMMSTTNKDAFDITARLLERAYAGHKNHKLDKGQDILPRHIWPKILLKIKQRRANFKKSTRGFNFNPDYS